jgi:hypothetical protein
MIGDPTNVSAFYGFTTRCLTKIRIEQFGPLEFDGAINLEQFSTFPRHQAAFPNHTRQRGRCSGLLRLWSGPCLGTVAGVFWQASLNTEPARPLTTEFAHRPTGRRRPRWLTTLRRNKKARPHTVWPGKQVSEGATFKLHRTGVSFDYRVESRWSSWG